MKYLANHDLSSAVLLFAPKLFDFCIYSILCLFSFINIIYEYLKLQVKLYYFNINININKIFKFYLFINYFILE